VSAHHTSGSEINKTHVSASALFHPVGADSYDNTTSPVEGGLGDHELMRMEKFTNDTARHYNEYLEEVKQLSEEIEEFNRKYEELKKKKLCFTRSLH